MYNINAQIEEQIATLRRKQAQCRAKVENDFDKVRELLEKRASVWQNVDTYSGWQNRGVQVRANEQATKIDGNNYFHFTQTTGFTL